LSNENLFFDRAELKSCGSNVIIGKTVRIRYPELVEIGDNVIIDDFTYISTALALANNTHIAAGCKLIGGRTSAVVLGEFSTLSPNVVFAAGSDDYLAGIATPMVPAEYKGGAEFGTIRLGRHCIVGANSTVLPHVKFADGAALGAQSLAKIDLEAWSLYAGVPARKIKSRDRDAILALELKYKKSSEND
jgi:acetyltransferase-like isoleucine patch superfamily enzyme